MRMLFTPTASYICRVIRKLWFSKLYRHVTQQLSLQIYEWTQHTWKCYWRSFIRLSICPQIVWCDSHLFVSIQIWRSAVSWFANVTEAGWCLYLSRCRSLYRLFFTGWNRVLAELQKRIANLWRSMIYIIRCKCYWDICTVCH